MARWRATTSQGTFKPFFCFSPPVDLDITKDDATPPRPQCLQPLCLDLWFNFPNEARLGEARLSWLVNPLPRAISWEAVIVRMGAAVPWLELANQWPLGSHCKQDRAGQGVAWGRGHWTSWTLGPG